MTLQLTVTPRTESADRIRTAGNVPAVVYGPKQEPLQIAVDKLAFTKILENGGEATIIALQGLAEEVEVLIQAVDFNPAKGGVMHADFYAIERGKELTTTVPLHYVGEMPVEKKGGVLTKVLHEVTVTCRPSVLPSHIDVDMSKLVDFDQQILVNDLNVPEGVTIDHEEDETVASVVAVQEESETEPGDVDMDAVAVEQKGKGEGEESEAS